MEEEFLVGWFATAGPVRLEIITDARGWREVEPLGVGYMPGCLEGTIVSEPGYLRGVSLFGDDPEAFGTTSNIMALPEPAQTYEIAIGLILLCALFALGGRGRAR